MAHASTMNRLAEGLVTSITQRPARDSAFRKLREQTVRGLKDQSHARTNQFAVTEKLDGLVEKFTVLNRDDLAEALQGRLEELPSKSRWMPEFLSLLLELSNRPAEKTSLESVTGSKKSDEAEHGLTWEEITADDPFDEADIWDNVERCYHSSDDDELVDSSEPTTSTQASSVEDDPSAIARLQLSHPSQTCIEQVMEARSHWDEAVDDILTLSELAVIREMLSMLHGLPTDLFQVSATTGRITLARSIHVSTSSQNCILDILRSSIDTGNALNYLRTWDIQTQSLSYLQSIQAAVRRLLTLFGQRLAKIERRFIEPTQDAVVSIVEVQSETQEVAGPLVKLSSLIRSSAGENSTQPFALLDGLYEAIAIAQMADDVRFSDTLATAFLSGFKTFLRPVATWLRDGSIDQKNGATFFIFEANRECQHSELWHRRFEMRQDSSLLPNCIKPFAQRIFSLGKSRFFLHRLDKASSQGQQDSLLDYESPDLDHIQHQLREGTWSPFPELIDNMLHSWITHISSDSTPLLRTRLFYDCGLARILAALPIVYFSHDGAVFQVFSETLVERMTNARGVVSWSDQFLLTELAQSTFGAVPAVDADGIYVKLHDQKAQLAGSAVRRISLLSLHYAVPWQVQNITRSETLDAHATVFSFLLQISVARSFLSKNVYNLRSPVVIAGNSLKLCQRLQCFIDTLHTYTVLTTHTLHAEMQERIGKAEDIDAMVVIWTEYEKRLQANLLLTPNLEPVQDALISILEMSEHQSKTTRSQGAMSQSVEQFDRSMTFLIAGLRGVSRAGGETALETLAERLEWNTNSH